MPANSTLTPKEDYTSSTLQSRVTVVSTVGLIGLLALWQSVSTNVTSTLQTKTVGNSTLLSKS